MSSPAPRVVIEQYGKPDIELEAYAKMRIYLDPTNQRFIEVHLANNNQGPGPCRVVIYSSDTLYTVPQSSNVIGVDLARDFEMRADCRKRDMAELVFDEFMAAGASFNDCVVLAQTVRDDVVTRNVRLPQWVRDAAKTLAVRFKLTGGS